MCSVSGEFKQEFDLVLVFPVFRTATAFLSIIKYLHTSYSVGILLCRPEGSENQEKKSGQTDNQFLALCRELGADIIEEGPVRSRLVILSYSSYSREYLDALKRKVISDRYWIMHGVLSGNFAMEGIAGFEFEKHLYGMNNLKEKNIGVGLGSTQLTTDLLDAILDPNDKILLFAESSSFLTSY